MVGGILGSGCSRFVPGSSDVCVTGCFFGGFGAPGVSAVLFFVSLGGIFRYHSTLVAGSESQLGPGGPLFLYAVHPSMLNTAD